MTTAHRGACTQCSCRTDVLPGPGGPITVVTVAGEIDITNYAVLTAAVARAFADRPAHLVVDVAELRFCCARGVSLLTARTGPAATASDVSYALSGLPDYLERLCRIVGGAELPVRYPSATAAIDGIRRRMHGSPGSLTSLDQVDVT